MTKKLVNILMLGTVILTSQVYADLDIYREENKSFTSSMTANFSDMGEEWEIVPETEKVGLNVLIQDAALAASASYNHQDIAGFKSSEIRGQDDMIARETMVMQGDEIITFSASIKKNPLLGNAMANGQMQAGLIAYSVDALGVPTIKVAFHGTENLRDLQTDGNFLKSHDSLLSSGNIHSGFYNRYMESREAMMDAIQGVLGVHNITADQVNFLVTGHSLGGALATLAAVDIRKTLSNKASLELVTFSSPRVFDVAGAKEAENLIGSDHILRIWRKNDLIPAIAIGALGYKHIGRSIVLESTVTPEDGFLARNIPLNMKDHSMGSILDDIISQKKVTFDESYKGLQTRFIENHPYVAGAIGFVGKTVSGVINTVKNGITTVGGYIPGFNSSQDAILTDSIVQKNVSFKEEKPEKAPSKGIISAVGNVAAKLNPFNWFR